MKSKTALFDMVNTFCKNGYSVNVSVTQYPAHGRKIAKENADKYDILVCCGGDGSLNDVINGIIDSGCNVPLGYIPAGSTNDFAAATGLSSNPQEAAENICKGSPKGIDIGDFEGRYFSYIASFGAFTATSYQTPQSTKNALGHFAYVIEGIKDIGSIKPYNVKITADGNVFEGNYIFGAITNTTSIGGLLKFDSSLVFMDDGLFEVLLVKFPTTPIELHQIVYGLTYSDFENNSSFEFFKASAITLECSECFDWTLDGEHQSGKNKVEIFNVNNGIQLMK